MQGVDGAEQGEDAGVVATVGDVQAADESWNPDIPSFNVQPYSFRRSS